MSDERYVPRQALSKEEIHKMPNRELAGSISPEERLLAQATAKSTWDSRPMKRRPDESAGEFARRKREAKQTDKEEYSRLLRASFEKALFDSKDQKLKRLTDNFTSNITREKAAANQKVVDDLEQKGRRESFSDGGSFRPKTTE